MVIKPGEETLLEYNPACLYEDKLEFKILIMVSLLSENNCAYRGNLNDISKELGYAGTADTRRNRRIKEAIERLEQIDLIKVIRDKNTYTISLSVYAEENKIKIAKNVVKNIRDTLMGEKNGHDWSFTLKVLLYLYWTDNPIIGAYSPLGEWEDDTYYVYYMNIAEELKINKEQVGFALKQLEEKFQAITTKKNWKVEKSKGEGLITYKRLPTTITIKREK